MKDFNGVEIEVGDTLMSTSTTMVAYVKEVDEDRTIPRMSVANAYDGYVMPVYDSHRWEVVREDQPLVCLLPAWNETDERKAFLQKCEDFWLL